MAQYGLTLDQLERAAAEAEDLSPRAINDLMPRSDSWVVPGRGATIDDQVVSRWRRVGRCVDVEFTNAPGDIWRYPYDEAAGQLGSPMPIGRHQNGWSVKVGSVSSPEPHIGNPRSVEDSGRSEKALGLTSHLQSQDSDPAHPDQSLRYGTNLYGQSTGDIPQTPDDEKPTVFVPEKELSGLRETGQRLLAESRLRDLGRVPNRTHPRNASAALQAAAQAFAFASTLRRQAPRNRNEAREEHFLFVESQTTLHLAAMEFAASRLDNRSYRFSDQSVRAEIRKLCRTALEALNL